MNILIPVFIQVALTVALVLRLGVMRVGALKRGDAKMGEVAKSKGAWPEPARRVADSYANQAELPVMFYGAVAMILATGHGADGMLVGLTWAFVGFRLVQAAIHTTYNNVEHRFFAFGGSILSLVLLWTAFAFSVFS